VNTVAPHDHPFLRRNFAPGLTVWVVDVFPVRDVLSVLPSSTQYSTFFGHLLERYTRTLVMGSSFFVAAGGTGADLAEAAATGGAASAVESAGVAWAKFAGAVWAAEVADVAAGVVGAGALLGALVVLFDGSLAGSPPQAKNNDDPTTTSASPRFFMPGG